MSEELVVLNNNTAVANVENDNANWGDDDSASKPSYIAIKQALTEGFDSLPNGTLFDKSGQVWENNTIEAVILKMGPTRAWKPSAPKFVKDEKAKCRSDNRKTPLTGFGLVPQAKDCASCPKASWASYNKETGEGNKPTCDKGFYILFIDRETNLPYIYTATGQSVAPAEAMYDTMKKQAKLVKAKTNRMPNTYDYLVSFTTERGNKAFKIKFTKISKLTEEAAARFGPLYETFVVNRNAQVVDDEPTEGSTQVYEAEDTGAVVIDADEPAVAI